MRPHIARESSHDKAAASGCLAELFVQFRGCCLQGFAVQACAGDGLPCDFEIIAIQGIRVKPGHVAFEFVFNAGNLSIQIFSHAAQFSQFVNFLLQFGLTHFILPLSFCAGAWYNDHATLVLCVPVFAFLRPDGDAFLLVGLPALKLSSLSCTGGCAGSQVYGFEYRALSAFWWSTTSHLFPAGFLNLVTIVYSICLMMSSTKLTNFDIFLYFYLRHKVNA